MITASGDWIQASQRRQRLGRSLIAIGVAVFVLSSVYQTLLHSDLSALPRAFLPRWSLFTDFLLVMSFVALAGGLLLFCLNKPDPAHNVQLLADIAILISSIVTGYQLFQHQLADLMPVFTNLSPPALILLLGCAVYIAFEKGVHWAGNPLILILPWVAALVALVLTLLTLLQEHSLREVLGTLWSVAWIGLLLVLRLGMASCENKRLYRRLQASASDLQGQMAAMVQLNAAMRASTEQAALANAELQRLDRLRSDLLQVMSHELRTPLVHIKGYAELLMANLVGQLTPEQAEVTRVILRRSADLERTVNAILALTSAGSGQLQRTMLNLGLLLQSSAEQMSDRARLANLAVQVDVADDLPLVLGDAWALTQIVDSLLDNAIKFSPAGGTIRLCAHPQGERVRIEVSDPGIGIVPDLLIPIWQAFYQADSSTTRVYGGLGLGLAVVKQVVIAHGGEVGVESQPEQGSTFWFTLLVWR